MREEKKREKTHRREGGNGNVACLSVGGPRTDVGVWGGAEVSLDHVRSV